MGVKIERKKWRQRCAIAWHGLSVLPHICGCACTVTCFYCLIFCALTQLVVGWRETLAGWGKKCVTWASSPINTHTTHEPPQSIYFVIKLLFSPNDTTMIRTTFFKKHLSPYYCKQKQILLQKKHENSHFMLFPSDSISSKKPCFLC